MRKNFRLIILVSFMLAFVISSVTYNQSESSLVISLNLLNMLVSAYLYFIIRILGDLTGSKE